MQNLIASLSNKTDPCFLLKHFNDRKNNMLSSFSSVLVLAVLGMGGVANPAFAEDPSDTVESLETIDVTAQGVSAMDSASSGDVSHEELAARPILRPGAVLEAVPGLVVTQHSGEGKANQYFLRAFNLDHGTDLAVRVDGMPVNMPTHGHGQGYNDLNFLIPELVGDLHYKKGPYFADEGDFATAGTVRMSLMDKVDTSATVGYGQDGYKRMLLMGSPKMGSGTLLYAAEYYHNDGPYDYPDKYRKFNGVLRYRQGSDRDYFTITGMAYDGNWNSTDQVAQRAIDSGLIPRFGSLNPTDGGKSSRQSLSVHRVIQNEANEIQLSAYYIRSKLDLYSDFTYFLDDPVNGDQMLQRDRRTVAGVDGSYAWNDNYKDVQFTHLVGIQNRNDWIPDVGRFATVSRQIQNATFDSKVNESNVAVYYENNAQWRPDIRTIIGLREDYFNFDGEDKLIPADSSSRSASIFSPKFGLVMGPWDKTTYFVNVAEGYHSNDARGVTKVPAAFADPTDPANQPAVPLVRAKSAEAGLRSVLIPQWETEVAVFTLDLASELVFSGDGGTTEVNGATRRTGIEWSNKYHFNNWVTGDLNVAETRGRFKEFVSDDLGIPGGVDYGGKYIPNSPQDVVNAGITVQNPTGWFGSFWVRHFGSSPLVEDNSKKSPAFTTFDMQVGYQQAKQWEVALDIFNLTDKKWNDITYFYASQLQGESSPVADYHVHPGEPRTLRLSLKYFL